PTYSANTDFSRPGRGEEEFREKCHYTLRRLVSGQLPGLRSLEDIIQTWERKRSARAAFTPQVVSLPSAPIQTVDFMTLMTEEVEEEPDYIEPGFAGPGNF